MHNIATIYTAVHTGCLQP